MVKLIIDKNDNFKMSCKEMLPRVGASSSSSAVLGVPVVELRLVSTVSIARRPGVLLRPAGRRQVGGGGRRPGTVPAALLGVGVG